MTDARILVADDDPAMRELMVHRLTHEGFHPLEASDGVAALRHARDGVDLAILDLGLPGVDGFNVIRTMRREGLNAPILVCSGRIEEIDRVVCFELGADDYVDKPFSPREVVCRVRAILRRSGKPKEAAPAPLRFGTLEIDEAARAARVDGQDVGLRPREFALLHVLASNPGVALSRKTLIEKAWGYDYDGDDRTVDGHIRRIRHRLEEEAHLPPCILTIYGFGYKFAGP